MRSANVDLPWSMCAMMLKLRMWSSEVTTANDTGSGHGRRTLARLTYSMIASLDGYVADEDGGFDWAAPDDEVHAFVNDLERPVGTYLFGRRMYEVMAAWETMHTVPDLPPAMSDFASIWRAADKVVYSSSLETVSTARTRLEREFDPEAVRRLKAVAGHDLGIGGPELAGQALRAGLVDELGLFTVPAVVGGGTPWLPPGVRLQLHLLEERRFASGIVYLRYGVSGGLDRPPRGE
jgi:dihydrofolate reductase